MSTSQGWHQHPSDPPGHERWWDGTRWTEHTQQSRSAAKAELRKATSGLQIAGFVTFLLGLLFWPIFIAPFVIGIVLAARGEGGQGALLIVLSVLGPLISLVGCAAYLSGS